MCAWPRPKPASVATLTSMFSAAAQRDEPMTAADIRPEEVLIDVMQRLITGARQIAVGANSPIPAAAAFLAQHLALEVANVSLQQSPEHNLWTYGGRELFDSAGQGRIDVFFFSGAQIDG